MRYLISILTQKEISRLGKVGPKTWSLIYFVLKFWGKQVYMKQNIRKEYKITNIEATVRGLHGADLSPYSLPLLHVTVLASYMAYANQQLGQFSRLSTI